MNKVTHIMEKAAHGLDKLSPSEIVWEFTKIVVTCASPIKYVDIILASADVIRVVCFIIDGELIGVGTAYMVEEAGKFLDTL